LLIWVISRVGHNCTLTPYMTVYLGLARTIYIRCIYGNFGREITKYTVIYGVYIWFWPTLEMMHQKSQEFGPNRLHSACTRIDFMA